MDALTGEIVETHDRIHENGALGTAQTRYSGERTIRTDSVAPQHFRLRDYTRSADIITRDMNSGTNYGAATEITDENNIWEAADHDADGALDAHWGTEMTFDYFWETHGLNSLDGEGAPMLTYVDYGNGFVNAFWNGEVMTYGAGSGIYTPLTCLDIVGHEITHGITQFSAGLIYSNESGALNESFSDIFGVVVDFYAREESANYVMGDNAFPTPIRSMENPNLYESPDTYLGDYWVTGSFDNGGVHYNSGVQNYWFYLLCEGGTGTNDNGDDYSVAPIGMEAAADIAFRNLTVYLTPSSQYFDARFYSIQSAWDLFGACSAEVIAVANAWHAVGVGEMFDDAVVAQFSVSNTYACDVPATVQFTDQSINASTYLWDFGDGNTSDQVNPQHSYEETGIYSVSLSIEGSADCNDSDSVVMTALIEVTDDGGPASASCQPLSLSPSEDRGINFFELGGISNASGSSMAGYEDFTCESSGELTEGSAYPMVITTLSQEFVKVWIDLNGDNTFSENELIYASTAAASLHNAEVIIPQGSVYGEPLRLRVQSDPNVTSDACQDVHGQVEDYAVTITENLTAPVADFTAGITLAQTTEPVIFTDLSLNLPSSRTWTFEGGSPATSTAQNPTVTYAETGSYDVMLAVSNAYGADTLIMTNYINVTNSINMCEQAVTAAPAGIFYDSGGPDGNYSNNENCTLLISPDCAQSITMTFSMFSLEGCCDFFRAYDGNSADAPLLFSGNGNNMPPPLTAASGEMFIWFTSDFSITRPGWAAEWTSETPNQEPVAVFAASSDNPALNTEVVFTDASLVFPASWSWDFGDGNTSTEQSPAHTYTEPGTYTVSLAVANCFGSDSTSQEITVQGPPSIEITPADTLHVTIPCGGAGVGSYTISNNGVGDLEVSQSHQGPATHEVLAWIPHANLSVEYHNTLFAINAHFTDYNLTESFATTASALEESLTDIDILLVPEQATAPFMFFTTFADVLSSYAADGGHILFCASVGLPNTGLFNDVIDYAVYGSVPMVNVQPSHPMMEAVADPFMTDNMTMFYNWTSDPEMTTLAAGTAGQYENATAVGIKPYGDGLVAYVGYDFWAVSENNSRIIGNTMQYLAASVGAGWIDSVSLDDTETIAGGESLTVEVNFNADNLHAGDYYEEVVIFSNDSEAPALPYVYHITVTGEAGIQVETQTIDLESVFVGGESSTEFVVYNSGCETLTVNTFVPASGFSVTPEQLVIEAFGQDTLTVNFHPTEVGLFTGVLEITGNGGNVSVTLNGEGMESPEMVVSPPSINVDVPPCADSVLVNFNIANTGGGILEYSLGGESSVPLFDLEEVLNALSEEYSSITSLVPDAINFHDGDTGDHIPNGGGGMYNQGNYLNTDFQNAIPYTGSEIVETDAFGPDSRYFTSKNPGLFALAADLGGTDEFSVTGTTGTGGAGSANGLELIYTPPSGVEYTGFVKRIFGANTPTINHIIITETKPGINHFFPVQTSNGAHTVSGLTESERIYFLLFATIPTGYVDDSEMQEIFETFVDVISGHGFHTEVQTGSVQPGSDVQIELYLPVSTLEFGEYETHVVVSGNDPAAPQDSIHLTLNVGPEVCPKFEVVQTSECSGLFIFTDRSMNHPTSWSWDFGDGNTSTAQHPEHQYETSGEYTVVLEACNDFGCDTAQKQIFPEVISSPAPAACIPDISGTSTQFGIYSFSFGEFQNTSGDIYAGYEDFTCLDPIQVTVGEEYLYQVLFPPGLMHYLRIWIDLNNNGSFEENELIVNELSEFGNSVGTASIPVQAAFGQPLRMRVAAGAGTGGPCASLNQGETEDYTVIVNPITEPPAASMSWIPLNECQGVVQFTDNSSNYPNSWAWDFGDGTTSNLQNPVHMYAFGGDYQVSLSVFNGFGVDTLIENISIPHAGFTSVQTTGALVTDSPITFSAPAEGVSQWHWNFGDGSSATVDTSNVTRTYSTQGTYAVTVSTSSDVCNPSIFLFVNITSTVSDGIQHADGSILVYPNPSNGRFNISFPPHLAIRNLRIFDPLGKALYFQTLSEEPDRITLLVPNSVAGLYIVEAVTAGGEVLRARMIME